MDIYVESKLSFPGRREIVSLGKCAGGNEKGSGA